MSDVNAGFEAFSKAQSQFRSAIKDAANPFFKSKYADLSSIWEAVKAGLSENGLMVTQPIRVTESGIQVETIIRYKDGTIIESCHCPVFCKVQNDAQAMGSAITYARRYSLASILCIVTDDDDANGANGQPAQSQAKPAPSPQPAPAPPTPKPATKEELAKMAKWQTDIDTLPNDPQAYTEHRAALARLTGIKPAEIKELFDKFRGMAWNKGIDYNETDKVFYHAEPTPA
ncbi:ERF family protein [Spirosoma luteum]|uniref:ERF family protein n=1 Tax=Spirosoma luteum TaxID=431553 RepID=UPI00035E531E|nr:ERF family protein [Spirosoma luteum]